MEYLVKIFNLFVYSLKNTFNYHGRASRKEIGSILAVYIMILLVVASINILLSSVIGAYKYLSIVVTVLSLMDTLMALVIVLLSILFCLMWISASVRRLHDINKSGWWVLLINVCQLLPVLNLITLFVVIYLYFIKKGG